MPDTASIIQNPPDDNPGSIAEKPEHPQIGKLWPYVLVSALLMTAAFPPLDLGFLAWIGLAPLLYSLSNAHRPRRAFGLAYFFGIIHWGLSVVWIGTTVVVWSGTPFGWIAWILLVAIKSLWFGVFGFLAWWIGRRSGRIPRMLALAAAWAAMEWLRTQSSVAMPWTFVGYTQYRYPIVIQAADLGGVYLLSFVVVLVNAGVGCRVSGIGRTYRELALPVVVVIGLLVYGGIRLGDAFPGESLKVALMQPNVKSERGETETEAAALAKYMRMAESATASQIMVWPESTAEQVTEDPESRRTFSDIAKKSTAYQIVGTGYADESGASHNSAAVFAPTGELVSRYDKHWLVPFGEWVPFRSYLPLGDVFGFPPRDVVPGDSNRLMEAGPARMSLLICYESVFPVLGRVRTAAGANLIVSITNDSWAGESELRQHHAMTVMRAVETRRFVASSATTGITALIEPTGRWKEVPPYGERILAGEARLCGGFSPYVRWGDWFVFLCGILILGALSGVTRKNT